MKNQIPADQYLIRFQPMDEDLRGPYFRDQTAIIHSFPFRRLKRKTQVFFAPDNDHICTRIEHVFHVFTNSTTVCKGLVDAGWSLDIEMAQAIALGHDIGHAPFGHAGEDVLSQIIQRETGSDLRFHHEINSLRFVDYIAKWGNGLKLTFGVRDGIVSHCGEHVDKEQHLTPDWTIVDLNQICDLRKKPASYEGCIVRVTDKISSLGRDIEDAIRLGIISAELIPEDILTYLHITTNEAKYDFNRSLLKNVIIDIVQSSIENESISMSDACFELIQMINSFSTKEIYYHPKINDYKYYVSVILNNLYNSLRDLFTTNEFEKAAYENDFIRSHREFGRYLNAYQKFYQAGNYSAHDILIDYISGMSDNYAISFSKDISIPKTVFKWQDQREQ